MTILITGSFQQQTEAQRAIRDLLRAGFTADQTTAFYVSSAGQHDLYPIGGDEDKSPGMEGAKAGVISGIAIGGAIGVAVGIAAAPVLGPVAAIAGVGVGAYGGSLYGALGSVDDKNVVSGDPQCKSGMLVAVSTPTFTQQNTAIHILHGLGATNIDKVQGTLIAGEWVDFSPLMPLHRVTEQVLENV